MSLVRTIFAVAPRRSAGPGRRSGKGPPDGKHLELSVVSSPPELVSGGDARVEVAVPDKVALNAVTSS